MYSLLKRYRGLPIAKKMAAIIFLTGSVAAILGMSARLYIFHSENVEQLAKHSDTIVESSLPAFQAAVIDTDKGAVKKALTHFSRQTNVVRVELIDLHQDKDLHEVVQKPQLDNHKLKIETRKQYKIPTQNGVLTLIVWLEAELFNRQFLNYLFYNLALEAVIVLFIALGILFFVKRFILRHLEGIATYAHHLSLDNLTSGLLLDRKKYENAQPDELDLVIDAFEHMRHRLIHDLDRRRNIELELITEKEEKEESRKLIEEAQAANRSKSQFIATMSHEIRTPMNGVVGMVEMLRDTPLNENQKHYLDVIHRSGETLMDIINDILDYSKIDAGKMNLEKVEFDLEELIDDCVQLFGATTQRRKIELISSVTPNTPTKLIGDPTRLRQIIVNLIGNAFKFTSEGYIFVQANAVSSEYSETPLIHFAVEDSGIGIETKVKNYIFDAFSQADSTTTRKYGGTGLGLAICRQLAELMGGEIGVDSELGRGSTFWFTALFDTPDESMAQEMSSCSLKLSGRKLLTIHNSRILDKALNSHCLNWNLSCRMVHSGVDAMRIIRKENTQVHYDFILLNQSLPDCEGIDLAEDIRKVADYADTPLLMITDERPNLFSHQQLMAISTMIPRPISVSHLKNMLLNEASGFHKETPVVEKPNERQIKQKLNVLVAEDNAVNRMVIEGLLNKFDIHPTFTENGLETYRAVAKADQEFDLIFMDCEMPEMDGFEATQKIREFEKQQDRPPLPIIALTAHVETEHRKRVFDCGMNYYLSKPVSLDKLQESLSSIGVVI